MSNDERKSPLRQKPLRLPGQSTQEAADQFYDDKVMPYFVASVFIVVMALLDWARWLFRLPNHPWVTTAVAIAVIGYSLFRLRPLLIRHRQLKLGRDGERAVGQELEKLRERGYRVYHDFLAGDFNIDHIVVGPTGVFAVETKTFRKPKDPDAKISYDGHVVSVPGVTLTRNPITQAKAEGDHIRDWIKHNANRTPPVRPAVVFVGWYTQRQPEGAEVWVLNVPGLVSFIQNERSRLSEDDIVHICGVLETHILNKQRELYG
jgi:hypothetical protein